MEKPIGSKEKRFYLKHERMCIRRLENMGSVHGNLGRSGELHRCPETPLKRVNAVRLVCTSVPFDSAGRESCVRP